jgi:threonine dehydratase
MYPPGLISDEDIRAAQEVISRSVGQTPLVRLNVEDAPAEIYLKLENLNPTGSFKVRGATYAMHVASPAVLKDGVWTMSAGNMAQALAFQARARDLPCTVVVPETAPQAKIDAIDRLGARIIREPFDDWLRIAETRYHPAVEGFFVHPFSDPAVMAGNSTIGLEIMQDLADVDAIVVPYGGGGLSCGIASAIRMVAPRVRVYACEFEPTAPLSASLAAGRPVEVPYLHTFIDGIGAPIAFPEMFELARFLLDGSLVSGVPEVAEAVRLLAVRNHVVAEGAGAASVAAALAGKAGGGKVACIVSGGNIDAAKLAQILGGQLPESQPG